MPLLELRDVRKSFGALVVADGTSFSLADGEALGIIGPNGAGKSTLFNLVTGNVRADGGTIRFDGEDVTHLPPMRRCLAGIGRTFQIPQPFGKLSVFENCLVAAAFGRDQRQAAFGSKRGQVDATEACAEILRETGLLPHANKPAGSLSLLGRKRLELARALATDPKLLLLDEIAGGLTEAEAQVLVETIRAVHKRGVSIVWIEHVLHALNAVVSRLLVLNFGRLIAEGAPAAVMASRAVREIYLGLEA